MIQYMNTPVKSAIDKVATLPGIGPKSAQRIVSYLLKQPAEKVAEFTEALLSARMAIKSCSECGCVYDTDGCRFCRSVKRNRAEICVVAETKDAELLDGANTYTGLFHVLGGVISAMNGIGPDQLKCSMLLRRLTDHPEVKEVILALPPTMDGDTTSFYLNKQINKVRPDVKVTMISRGIPIGSSLEYVDELTLGKSLSQRVVYHLSDAA